MSEHKVFLSKNDLFLLDLSSATPTSKSQSSSSPAPLAERKGDSSKNNPGEMHNELDQIDVKFEKISDEQSTHPKSSLNSNKHSPHASNPSGFSLKNPVSSFRSWVTNKKSSKEEVLSPDQSSKPFDSSSSNQSNTPLESDSGKRNRTNSASMSSSTVNSNHQIDNPNNASSASNSTRVKKKSSFNMRPNNPMTLLKRNSETTSNENESTEQTANTGPLGYLKNLVRGDKP